MPLIESLIAKLQRHPKRFVFPEGSDHRSRAPLWRLNSRRSDLIRQSVPSPDQTGEQTGEQTFREAPGFLNESNCPA